METLRLKKTKDKINEVTNESILLFTRQNGSSFPNVCASEVNKEKRQKAKYFSPRLSSICLNVFYLFRR